MVGCKSGDQTTGTRPSSSGKKGQPTDNFAAAPELADVYFDAATYQANRNWPKAISGYQKVLSKYPKHATTHYNLAEIHAKKGEYEQAQNHIEKALKHAQAPNLWFFRLASNIYNSQRKYEEAAAVLEEALVAFPKDVNLMLELAQSYLTQGEYDRVLALFDRIEEKTGPDQDISQRRVEIYRFKEENDKALGALKKMMTDFPLSSEPKKQYVKMLIQLGREAEAVAVLENSLKDNPGDGFALFSLIQYYEEHDEQEKAAKLKRQAFDNPAVPLNVKMQYLVELMRVAENDEDESEITQYIHKLYKENPQDGLLLAMMGQVYEDQEKPDSARIYYKLSLVQDELNKMVWQSLMNLESQAGNWDSLRVITDEALILFPNDLQFNYNNGIAQVQTENYKQAKRPLEKVLKLDEDNYNLQAQINTLLGDVHHYLDEFDQSREYYTTAMMLDPGNISAANNYAYFLAKRDVDLEKALELIEKAIDKAPNNGNFQDTYAYVFFKLERYDEALTWARRAYQDNPSTEVAEHLGDIHNALGDTDKARQFWQEALKKDDDNDEIKQKLNALK